jgi:predicted nuclease of predicted toxin-antitoxin system
LKVLLDECVTQRFRRFLPDVDCQSAVFAGFSGLKNGALLEAAELAGFTVIVTLDRNLPYQQSIEGRAIAMVVLRTRSSALSQLLPLVPKLLEAISDVAPGRVVYITG